MTEENLQFIALLSEKYKVNVFIRAAGFVLQNRRKTAIIVPYNKWPDMEDYMKGLREVTR